MADKFGRAYRLTIDPNDGGDPIVVTLPLTMQFWMRRSQLASLNYCSIDIYNLSQKQRNRIFKDRFTELDRRIRLEAGYDELSLIFDGNLYEAGTSREGNNIITRLEARDGYFATGQQKTFKTISSGRTLKDVYEFLIGEFPDLERGAVGNYTEVLRRPVSFSGNTWDILKTYAGNDVFIDNNRIYVLKPSEIVGDTIVINAQTGLLETPRRDDGYLTVNTLFEPRIGLRQLVELTSGIQAEYDGVYDVAGVMHQGIISEAVNGTLYTTMELFIGAEKFTKVTA